MKKNLKKIFSAILACMLLVGMCATVAFAADAPIEGSTHTYKAYQIFSGTQADDSAELGSVDWGTGIKASDFLTALKNSTEFGSPNPFAGISYNSEDPAASAAAVALAMKEWTDGSAYAMAFAKLARKYVQGDGKTVVDGDTTLDAGYYLVIDTTTTVGEGDAYNLALLQLTKKGEKFAIAAKNSVPEVVKEVYDGEDYADANNANIGEDVSFRISTAVPTTAKEYDTYEFIIHDELSNGLTLKADSVKVYIDGSTTAATTTDYTFAQDSQNAQKFTVTILNPIAKAGKSVVVEYDATLNSSAAIGTAGNKNTAKVEYSNNPTDTTKKGTTPPDYSITYTSQINVYKVDDQATPAPLAGAKFKLYKGTNLINEVAADGDNCVANFSGLEEGTYVLEESVVPNGYNPIDTITFTLVCGEPEVVNGTETCTWTAEDVTTGYNVEYDATNNTFKITVQNQKGNTLPETGGIGTKIFYVIGAILVAGAAILLITRKRMSKADR